MTESKSGKFKPQESWAQRQKAKGLEKVAVWIPENKREDLLDFAEKLRQKR